MWWICEAESPWHQHYSPEGTYLAWLDCCKYITTEYLLNLMKKVAPGLIHFF